MFAIALPLAAFVALIVTIGGSSAAAAPQTAADTGTLAFQARVLVHYESTPCSGGLSQRFECFDRTGKEAVRGLGSLEESYAYVLENEPPGCTDIGALHLPATVARLAVSGKGAIDLRIDGTGCLLRDGIALRASSAFTITGGSGVYAGASGGGTINHDSFGPPGFNGTDTWTGTLVVPGLEFDVTAPTLSGATGKTVRAPTGRKRARVAYTVTATDDKDGAVPAVCAPKSRSWFPIGRTRVTCAADDTSGNRATAKFTVTVKRAG